MVREASLTIPDRNGIIALWLESDWSRMCRNDFLKWIEERETREIRSGGKDTKYWEGWNNYFKKVWG
jgi:hypothetical protein